MNLPKAVSVTEAAVSVGWGMGGLGPLSKTNAQVFVKPAGLPVVPVYRPLTVDPVEKHTVFD